MRRPTLPDLRHRLRQAIEKQQTRLAGLEEKKSNPTIAPMYSEIRGRLQAYEAVESALYGDVVLLRLDQ